MTLTAPSTLWIDAAATTATAVLMLALRSLLFPYFGLSSALPLDLVAAAFIVYAVVVARVAARPATSRVALMTVAGANIVYVVTSLALLATFWSQMHPIGRVLIVAVALAVELFAVLQITAARRLTSPVSAPSSDRLGRHGVLE